MSTKPSGITEDLGKLFHTAWVELPAAAVTRLFAGDDQDAQGAVRDAGWKAYDTWIRLANDASNRLYANPTFGAMTGRGIQAGLQVTRVVDAVASAIFGNLWPAIGLPTATDVQALRADVKSLREELRIARERAADSELDRRDEDAFVPPRAAHSAGNGADIVWNGYKPEPRPAARKGGKKSVAL